MKRIQSRRKFLYRLLVFSGLLLPVPADFLSACGDTGRPGPDITSKSLPDYTQTAIASPSPSVAVRNYPVAGPQGYTEVGPVEKFKPVEDPYGMQVTGKTVLVYNNGTDLLVFNDLCTHQGCQVEYITKSHKFICPCHGSEYNKTGEVLKGPALLPLQRLEYKVIDNILFVKFVVASSTTD